MIRHIGLIPDGNRRWARANSCSYREAYAKAMRRVIEFAMLCFNADFFSCSIYLLSTANLLRGRDDLEAVLDAETCFLSAMLPSAIDELKCKVIHAGRSSLLPNPMHSALKGLCEQTRRFSERTLYLLVGYDPIDELNAAVELAIRSNEPLDTFAHFWVPERIDVVFRTAGGPFLLSNFLPLQCGYAQMYMVEKHFPDCTDNDFTEIFAKARSVKMLYGG